MTSLAKGASITLVLKDGDTVSVATNGGLGQYWVTSPSSGGTVTRPHGPLAERRTHGPYKEGATLILANYSCEAFDYDKPGGFAPTFPDPASPTLVGVDGSPLYTGGETIYTKGLFFGNALTQAGSVKDFSSNGNDAVYAGGTTDAEVYNTTAGLLSCLGGTSPNNKGLTLGLGKIAWDLGAGQSLLVQARLQRDVLGGGGDPFMGCVSGTNPGVYFVMTNLGAIQIYGRFGPAGSFAQLGGSSTLSASAATPFNLTLWFDGGSKLFNGWMNGALQANWTNRAIPPDSNGSYATWAPATPQAWGLGNGGDTVSPSTRTMYTYKFAAARITVIEAGKTLQNAALLDWRFNRDPNRILTQGDLSLV